MLIIVEIFGDNNHQLNLIKFVLVPGLLLPTIAEIVLLIVNKSEEDSNKGEEDSDGYVKPDFSVDGNHAYECSCCDNYADYDFGCF